MRILEFPRQRMLNRIHNFGKGMAWQPFVRYDVFEGADASLHVQSDRPKQLPLPMPNFGLREVKSLKKGPKRRPTIFVDFHYAELEEIA